MRSYSFESMAGIEMGTYEGETELDAMIAMHMHAGYSRKTIEKNEDFDFLNLKDWYITEIEE